MLCGVPLSERTGAVVALPLGLRIITALLMWNSVKCILHFMVNYLQHGFPPRTRGQSSTFHASRALCCCCCCRLGLLIRGATAVVGANNLTFHSQRRGRTRNLYMGCLDGVHLAVHRTRHHQVVLVHMSTLQIGHFRNVASSAARRRRGYGTERLAG